jgi:hypothetical protein
MSAGQRAVSARIPATVTAHTVVPQRVRVWSEQVGVRRYPVAWLIAGVLAVVVLTACYLGLVTGAVSVDLRLGRRIRTLGPEAVVIAAPRDVVFAVIAAPYLGRASKAVSEKISVLERGADMVLAAHRTPIRKGRLVATTVETVQFSGPDWVDFRLVRGPVPHVVERFTLVEDDHGTRLQYRGELGTDLWVLGSWWGRVVGRVWVRTVAASLETIKTEAERRQRARS